MLTIKMFTLKKSFYLYEFLLLCNYTLSHIKIVRMF